MVWDSQPLCAPISHEVLKTFHNIAERSTSTSEVLRVYTKCYMVSILNKKLKLLLSVFYLPSCTVNVLLRISRLLYELMHATHHDILQYFYLIKHEFSKIMQNDIFFFSAWARVQGPL